LLTSSNINEKPQILTHKGGVFTVALPTKKMELSFLISEMVKITNNDQSLLITSIGNKKNKKELNKHGPLDIYLREIRCLE
jgi:hypothetical protein